MTTKKEYRGTVEFYRVLKECIEAAEHRGILYYHEVAELMPDVPNQGNRMANETGSVAGAVSTEMHENGLPMISALIVHTTDEKPGEGFYRLAHELGKFDQDPEDMPDGEKETFWREELDRVYDTWD